MSRPTISAVPHRAFRAVTVAALVLGSAACSGAARDKILPYFFDGFSEETKPRPPMRRLRRDMQQEITALKHELDDARALAKAREPSTAAERRLPVERATRWNEAAGLLPKDEAGRVDWVEALKRGAIAPRPAADATVPAQAVLELDVDMSTSGSRSFAASFPHAAHTTWLACRSCHPAIFPLGRRAAPATVSMASIRKGEQCGVCHGTVAFGVEGGCARCHNAIPAKSAWSAAEPGKPIERARTWASAAKLLPERDGGPDWTKALADGLIAPRPGIDPAAKDEEVFELDVVRAEGEAFKVVFSHAAHTALLVCDSCHPKPFQQAAGATPISMDAINSGEACGACHGKVAFPPDACGRCHPSM